LMMMDSAPQPSAEPQPTRVVDEDGWETVPVRRSNRAKQAPRFYDPDVQFPGAN